MMRAFVTQMGPEWDEGLPYLLFAYREVPVADYGFSPYELVFGRHVQGPLALVFDSWWEAGKHQVSPHVVDYMLKVRDRVQVALDTVHANQYEAQQKAKMWYDRKSRAVKYQPGDLVLVLQTQPVKPLTMRYTGPYKVLKQTSPVDYLIEFPNSRKLQRVIHCNLLKKYIARSEFVDSTPIPVQGVIQSDDIIRPVITDDNEELLSVLDTCLPIDYEKLLQEKTAHLTAEQASEVHALVNKYKSVISDKPGCAKDFVYKIRIKPGAQPTYTHPYRMSPQHQDKLRTEIDSLLKDGLIEPSTSEWCSAAILIPKPGGNVRCVVDYRKINNLIETESFPLKRVEDLVSRISNKRYISKFDLTKGFYQIPLDESCKHVTSFCTPFGQWTFRCLPFGLKTSNAKFSFMMSQILQNWDEFCGVYIDDVVIFSDTWEDHMKHIEEVLKRLSSAGLTVKLSKCYFACAEIEYLGHIVGRGNMSPGELKVKALLDALPPRNKRQLRSFIGMSTFYKRYLPHFSDIVTPLTDLLKKNKTFVWTDLANNAFETIKRQMTQSPMLMIARYDRPFVLFVDASNVAIGASIMQADDKGDYRPVGYFSKKLTKSQTNYCTQDKEALALISAIRAFSMYLSDDVIVFSDHKPLQYIHRMASANQRLLRWSMELQCYDITIKHLAGKNNRIADYLSRPCIPHDVVASSVSTERQLMAEMVSAEKKDEEPRAVQTIDA